MILLLFILLVSTSVFGKGDNPPKDTNYYKNIRGIFYITVDNRLALINHGRFGYLKHVDTKSFHILSGEWAKDKHHVFVPVLYGHGDMMRPTSCGIDVKTAEYFVKESHGWPNRCTTSDGAARAVKLFAYF